MASLIDIRRRLRSLKNTQQITRAMKMVAAAKLRRAQDRAIAARPYAKLLREVLSSVSASLEELKHPLLASREEKRVTLLIAAGDRGLAPAFIYEPDPETLLARLLPRYLEFVLFRMLLESAAAEHAARMTAMDSASRNAGDLIDSLTLTYNRARQARITKELIEIVSGSAAQE